MEGTSVCSRCVADTCYSFLYLLAWTVDTKDVSNSRKLKTFLFDVSCSRMDTTWPVRPVGHQVHLPGRDVRKHQTLYTPCAAACARCKTGSEAMAFTYEVHRHTCNMQTHRHPQHSRQTMPPPRKQHTCRQHHRRRTCARATEHQTAQPSSGNGSLSTGGWRMPLSAGTSHACCRLQTAPHSLVRTTKIHIHTVASGNRNSRSLAGTCKLKLLSCRMALATKTPNNSHCPGTTTIIMQSLRTAAAGAQPRVVADPGAAAAADAAAALSNERAAAVPQTAVLLVQASLAGHVAAHSSCETAANHSHAVEMLMFAYAVHRTGI
jgi:hypothetical protein